jgi:hypothetical protein
VSARWHPHLWAETKVYVENGTLWTQLLGEDSLAPNLTILAGHPFERGDRLGRGGKARFHGLRDLVHVARHPDEEIQGKYLAADPGNRRILVVDPATGEARTWLEGRREEAKDASPRPPVNRPFLGITPVPVRPRPEPEPPGHPYLLDLRTGIRNRLPGGPDPDELVPDLPFVREGRLRTGRTPAPRDCALLGIPYRIAFDGKGGCLTALDTCLAELVLPRPQLPAEAKAGQ